MSPAPRPIRRRRHRLAPGLATLALLVTVAGCSNRDADRTGPSTTAPSTTVATTAPSTTVVAQTPSTVAAPPEATVTQPAQPTSGPGGSALPHRDWTVRSGGTGADAWYAFLPADPTPRTAPVAIVLHGYYEYAGYDSMYEFIRHTVLGGSIVVYPRWQTDVAAPCPGPFDVEPCMDSAVTGIRDALAHLADDPTGIRPDVTSASYFGFSFGGILTANLTNRWRALHLPEPRVIFLDDLHDSGLDGPGEPALDDSMAGIPATVLLECHHGIQGVITEDPSGGCNALFPKLGHIPTDRKAIVATRPDDHGRPALTSFHGVCAARKGAADAYDWNFCWKVWDDLRAAADEGRLPRHAIGDDPAHADNGRWSDGTPIAPLVVRHAAPLGP